MISENISHDSIVLDPMYDNALGENWSISNIPILGGDFGTPGMENISNQCTPDGDVNQDSNIDILDIVMIIGYILETAIFSDTQICISDRNQDSDINVLDVVMLIGDILNV